MKYNKMNDKREVKKEMVDYLCGSGDGISEKFLNLLPFTAMSALIFPGVFFVDASHFWIGAIGAAVAIALSLVKRMPTFVVVIASVLSLMGIYSMFDYLG